MGADFFMLKVQTTWWLPASSSPKAHEAHEAHEPSERSWRAIEVLHQTSVKDGVVWKSRLDDVGVPINGGTPSYHPFRTMGFSMGFSITFHNKNHPAMGAPPWPWNPPDVAPQDNYKLVTQVGLLSC